MRHVPFDHNNIQYPDGWEERARAALQAVENVADDERSNVINNYRSVWAELKPELARIMNHKCWYTEAPQAGTDTDVDHFRPKNSVKDVKNGVGENHPGYWWRAFDPSNYRFSCIVANRRRRDVETGVTGGKADEFPIWDEDRRAWSPEDNCDEEQPLLIDPCNPTDVALLFFGENGEAAPRHKQAERPRMYAKADKSIRLYHLNHSDFVKARIKIRDDIRKLIEDANRYYLKLDEADVDTEHAYMRVIEQLREAKAISAPFSRFAVDLLEPRRYEESLAPVFI